MGRKELLRRSGRRRRGRPKARSVTGKSSPEKNAYKRQEELP